MFFLGASYAGISVVGISLGLEFLTDNAIREKMIMMYNLLEPSITLYWAFHFEYIGVEWFYLQLSTLIFAILILIYVLLVIPESPKFLYT